MISFISRILPLTVVVVVNAQSRFLDRFTYEDNDILRSDNYYDYSPENWRDISCDEQTVSGLLECEGYRDKWLTGRGWSIEQNYCRHCPEGSSRCGRHHQSPIDLKREFGLEPDYSKGFSQWWHLSHIDIHTPSEHTQDGVRYDAEIQLQHFYSVSASQAGVNNEMGTVSVFMQAYEDAAPYRYLDKLICQWRRKEYETLEECGKTPIQTSYPGCFPHKRRNLRRTSTTNSTTSSSSKFHTAQDVILHNDRYRDHPNHTDVRIMMEESNWGPAEDKDWDAWIAEQSKKMDEEEELYHRMRAMEHGGNHTYELHEQFRKLLEYDEIEWFNYWPMLGVRTEYYFRYSGSQTIPRK